VPAVAGKEAETILSWLIPHVLMLQDIDKLCTECASLIDNHDKIKDLSAVHYNLGKTLQDVENIVALPQQAAEAEDMLKDDTQLSEVLRQLSTCATAC